MQGRSSDDGSAGRHLILSGRNELTDVTQRALEAAGARVMHLRGPNDREIRRTLDDEIHSVAAPHDSPQPNVKA